MKLKWLVAATASTLMVVAATAAPAPSQWEQPAAALCEQIAAILGPAQAHITIRNQSTIPTDQIPLIRRLLEQNLKARGIVASGVDSANTIRVTLSENTLERIWVAEIVEGSETRVAMVHVDPGTPVAAQANSTLVLRKQTSLTSKRPVLAVLESNGWLAAVEPERLVLYQKSDGVWQELKRLDFPQKRDLPRDPRGMIMPAEANKAVDFEVSTGGVKCAGHFVINDSSGRPPAPCLDSDDPWPILTVDTPTGQATIKAFYNASRNYFTGVITPALGVDLPPFYSAALLPRPSGAALLINGIDGKVQLVENNTLKPVTGARDWGSDFAALQSGCGTGTQIIASGSGEALTDSLRAYELPAQEAIPASAPLAMEGTVTALWAAPDGKSVFAVVRSSADEFEVDRVTATCN